MKNALILHGLPNRGEYYDETYPSASNSHWLPWLQKHLMMNDIKADTPEVFGVYHPNYESYAKEVERFDITPETTLVGHSMGGGFIVRYMSEHPELYVDKVVLVAPWINSTGSYKINFFDFEIDPSIVERAKEFIIFASDNDSDHINHSIETLVDALPNVTLRRFHGYGHFTKRSMNTDAFPELLETLLSNQVE